MMPSWSNRLRISLLAALIVLATLGVLGFLSSNSPAVAQGTLTAPTNVTAVSDAAGELTLTWEGGDNADSFLLIAVHMETFAYETETVAGGVAKTGTVTGLTGGANYLGIVVALQATADGLATPYGAAAPIPVQGIDSQCSTDDYDRDEWGDYPGASDDATPTWTLPSDNVASPDITLDHHVALQDAHISGGCNWSLELKNDFATEPDNLNPTTRSFNSSKGSRTPDQLTGIAKSIIDTDDEKCDYSTQHDAVKDEYDLTMTANEQATVTEWLSLCRVASESDASTDKAALVALYNATGGPNWGNNRNWLSDRPIGEWSRVSTDGDGRVTGLWLDGNQLSGSIPSELGNLANLERLSLSRNSLSGPIPPGLLNLTELKELYLHTNQLSGTIPSSLSNLAGLEILLLYGNRFTGTIPSSLGNLSDLVELNLSSNDLTDVIPPELGRLTKLTYLSLRSNGLTGPIPSELGDMSSLRSLYLYDNQLDGPIPPNLKNLSNLEGLLLHDNQLSRPVPAWLGNLSRLRSLNLSINGFTGGIPPELGRLSNLSYLNLRSNDLTGPVPTELGNLSNLEQLYLYENQLSGEIPDSLGRLVNLTRLSLRDNQLTGEIPAELGNLVNLQLIWLGGNALTGCVPAALQNVADNDLDLLELPNCSEETIVTGFGMDIFDKAIPGLMTKWNIPGGAVALSRNGKLLLAKGYGYADIENREQVQPDSLFRIASLSKPITAVAVLKLVEDGHLNLDDRVFDILDQFEPPGGTIADPRIREVTVRQLLQHSGGWDRERSFDPMFRLGQIERELGVAKPVSCADVIRFMLIRPLDFDPGTDYRYSNFGYCILGRVIEAKTGHSYEAYVKNAVLNPVGITGMRIGGALLNERSEGEVRYYGYTGQSLADSVIPGTPQRVPWEYGGFSLQTMDSNGGWLASTMDLLRFVTALDESREPLILRSETVDTMTARPDIDRWRDSPWHYAMGWLVRPVNDDANWWHTGSLPGTRTLLVRIYPGMAWAVLFNSSPHDSEQMARELNELMWKVTSETSQWPSHDLFPRYGYE